MRFGKFLRSPYYNNREMLNKLFIILKRYHPSYEHKNLTKQGIYKKLYGDAAYNDSTLRNLFSDLQQIALQFLKTEAFRSNSIESSFFLTDELARRGLVKHFSERISATDSLIGKDADISSAFFLSKFRTQTDQFYLNLQSARVLKRSFVEEESKKLVNGIIFFMSYFLIESIRHSDNLIKYSRSYNVSSNMKTVSEFMSVFDIEKILNFISHNSELKLPIVEVYYKLLQTYLNFNEDNYYGEFKEFLMKHSGTFSLLDNHFLFARLLDYCVLKKNTASHTDFDLDNEIFELLTVIIRRGYYVTDSTTYIPFDLFRNYLHNCITLRRLDEMEDFINNFTSKLNPKQITNVKNYSFALLHFEKGNFTDALDLLNRIKFDQFIYKLDMKNLLLKIHYELGQYEAALYAMDSYKHFINNNVLVSDSKRVLHHNFISYVSKLIKFKNSSKGLSPLYLEEKLKKSKDTFNKEWLLDKMRAEKIRSGKKAI